MADNDWKSRLGVVYSTNPDFKYTLEQDAQEQVQTPEPCKQKLIVRIDRRARAGKQVTLIDGFVGREDISNCPSCPMISEGIISCLFLRYIP